MRSIFHLESPVMVFLSKLADLMLLNVVYWISCLPVVTVGAATSALYDVLFHMEKEKDVNLLRQYGRAFRGNWKKATILFLILLIPLALAVHYLLLLVGGLFAADPLGSLPFLIPAVLVFFIWTYVWPLQALFENTVPRTLRNAFVLSVWHLPTTVVCTILNLILPALFFAFPPYFLRSVIFWVVMGFSLVAMAVAKLQLPIVRKFYPDEENEEDA